MYTSWVIVDEAKDIRFRSCVVAEVVFEHGDADHSETLEFPVQHDRVVDFANFLELCLKTESEAAGGPGYRKLPGYEEFGEDFPRDILYNSCWAKVEAYKLFYYNGHGMKSNVKLETE